MDTPGYRAYKAVVEKYYPKIDHSTWTKAGFVGATVFGNALKSLGLEVTRQRLKDTLDTLSNFDTGLGPSSRSRPATTGPTRPSTWPRSSAAATSSNTSTSPVRWSTSTPRPTSSAPRGDGVGAPPGSTIPFGDPDSLETGDQADPDPHHRAGVRLRVQPHRHGHGARLPDDGRPQHRPRRDRRAGRVRRLGPDTAADWPYFAAIGAGILVAIVAGPPLRAVRRPQTGRSGARHRAPPWALFLLLQGLVFVVPWWGNTWGQVFDSPFANKQVAIPGADYSVSWDQLILFGNVLLFFAGLYFILRRTRVRPGHAGRLRRPDRRPPHGDPPEAGGAGGVGPGLRPVGPDDHAPGADPPPRQHVAHRLHAQGADGHVRRRPDLAAADGDRRHHAVDARRYRRSSTSRT